MLKALFGLIKGGFGSAITGPIASVITSYTNSKEATEQKRIERKAKRDFIDSELRKAMLDDDWRREQLANGILRRDRGDYRTAWIRPLTAALAILFWVALTLSQIEWVGYEASNALLPIVWQVPPGLLGQIFLTFPMGVLATFYVTRSYEKTKLG